MGRQKGLTLEKLQALHDYETSAAFGDLDRLCLRYADAMTATPVAVPDDLFAALRARFSEVELVELTATIAWENYRARYDHAFGIESQGFSEGAFCAVPARRSAGAAEGP